MLLSLKIENIAIIESADIEFDLAQCPLLAKPARASRS